MSNDPPSLPGEGNAEKSRKCIVIPCIWRTFLSSATKPRVKNWYDASLSMWRLIVFLPSVLSFISSQAQFSSRNPSLHGNGIFSEYWWFNYCDQGTSEVLSYQKTHQSQWPLQEYSVQTCTCKRMYTVLFPPHLSAPFPLMNTDEGSFLPTISSTCHKDLPREDSCPSNTCNLAVSPPWSTAELCTKQSIWQDSDIAERGVWNTRQMYHAVKQHRTLGDGGKQPVRHEINLCFWKPSVTHRLELLLWECIINPSSAALCHAVPVIAPSLA